MKAFTDYCQTYVLGLIRPWASHTTAGPPWDDELPRPAVAESLAMSWALAIIQGLSKLLLANLLVQAFLALQEDGGVFHLLVDEYGALLPYYLLVFSTALDLIFYPVLTMVTLEFWNFLIRLFGRFLGMGEERDVAARQITTQALSSNFFLIVPIMGPFLQKFAWLFLMYVGLRERLQASRSLTAVILVTPTVIMMMFFGFAFLGLFYLIKA